MTPEPTANHAPLPARAWLALAALLLALYAIISAGIPIISSALAPAANDPLTLTEQEQRVATYNASFDANRAQIDGRSLFFIPPEPPPKPKPKPKPRPQEEAPPPPPPATYGGPKPVAVVFDQVWFRDGRKIKVGDTDRDLEVISNDNAPWTVKLRWKGIEFDVDILERTYEKLTHPDGESKL